MACAPGWFHQEMTSTMRSVLLALSAAVLLVGCSPGAASEPAANQVATFNDADVRFLQEMIPHHRQAIELATLVDGRTRRPELAKLATDIAAAQAAEIQVMGRWLTRWDRPLPAVGTTDHASSQVLGMLGRGQLDWLQTLKGAPFDLGFVTMVRTQHIGAVEMAQIELRAGASGEAKTLATRIIAAREAQLRQLHDWRDAWSSDAGGASLAGPAPSGSTGPAGVPRG
jgi:uncharacterized protein (DUF305 family)